MAYGFIQQSRDQRVDELMEVSMPAFMLATQIARRARRDESGLNPHGLRPGEALVGDYRAIGLTEQQYRTAKSVLEKANYATFRATNKGTVGKLSDSSIYNLNLGTGNEQATSKTTNGATNGATNKQTPASDSERGASNGLPEAGNEQNNEQDNKPATTKNKVKNRKKDSPDGSGEGDERFKPVTDGYAAAYEAEFGEPYVHAGGRDGKALKDLLARLNAEFTTERIVKTARAAMQKHKASRYSTYCKYASTIHGFCGSYNEIRAELIATQTDGKTHRPTAAGGNANGGINRNAGTSNAGTTSDYSGLGRVADETDQVRDAGRPPVDGDAHGVGNPAA